MKTEENQEIGLWVFGYGSLIWRPEFAYEIAHWAEVDDWSRRFWQGSHDHRGTAEHPGRVLTLVPFEGARCQGRVFGVATQNVSQVLRELDYREKNGYERQVLTVNISGTNNISEQFSRKIEALTYIAPPTNIAWLGNAPDAVIAQQIQNSSGPSGSNADYVIELHEALLAQGINDKHINSIACKLK